MGAVTGTVTIGLDVGQRRDPTALCVVESEQRRCPDRGDSNETHFHVRHLERLALGMPYPLVAERVKAVAHGVTKRIGRRARLYVDATGVGLPVIDVLRAAKVEAEIVAVFLVHSGRRTEERGEVKLGKEWLVSRLQALLQARRVELPATAEALALAAELLTYEVRRSEHDTEQYGAFRLGAHDDLVTALGLAVQEDERPMGNLRFLN